MRYDELIRLNKYIYNFNNLIVKFNEINKVNLKLKTL